MGAQLELVPNDEQMESEHGENVHSIQPFISHMIAMCTVEYFPFLVSRMQSVAWVLLNI